MKRGATLLCVLFLAFSVFAQSGINSNVNLTPPPACQLSHVMGGDISLQHDSGSLYTLTLMIYRDTGQYPLSANSEIYVFTYDSSTALYLYDSSIIISKDTSLSASMAFQRAYGTEVGYYTRSLSLGSGKYQYVYV